MNVSKQFARKIKYRAIRTKLSTFLKQPASIPAYLALALNAIHNRHADLTIISYPKSGRTWLERCLIEAIRHEHQVSQNFATVSDACSVSPEIPTIKFTHAWSSWESLRVLDAAETEKMNLSKYADGKVIFLYRDPRDVLVSSFHHIRGRTGFTQITPDDMVSNKVIGISKVISFMNLWQNFYNEQPKRVLRVSYEELKQDTVRELNRIVKFSDLPLCENSIRAAVEECEFKKMQKADRNGSYASFRLRTSQPGNPDAYKVRNGKTGEYKEFFTDPQKEELEIALSDLHPAFHHYKL